MTASSVAASTVRAVRHFNRCYTRKIGVLDEGLLDSPYSLAEVRILYELAQRPGLTAKELIEELGLDAGYLSRMLARLIKRRLVRRHRLDADRRRMPLRLSSIGRRTFKNLNGRSSAQVRALIRHLPTVEQERLIELMEAVRHRIAPDERNGDLVLRAPKPGDLGWVVERHGALYVREHGWDWTFETLVARIVADFVEHFDALRDRCWIAELDGEKVGSVFLVKKTSAVARLRLLLVEPGARGRGVGRRLVEACVEFARTAGFKKIELWTNSVLRAARGIYERAGFKLVRSEKHHSFGRDLVGETWELILE